MVTIVEAVFLNELFVITEVLTVFFQVGQGIVIVFLEEVIKRPVGRELLVMKVAVTE